ncbi:hypothetical protein L9F63_019530, partial [Diploptera punctata]
MNNLITRVHASFSDQPHGPIGIISVVAHVTSKTRVSKIKFQQRHVLGVMNEIYS